MSLIFSVIVSRKAKISKTDTCRWTPQLHHHWHRVWDRHVRMEDHRILYSFISDLAVTKRPDNELRDVSGTEPVHHNNLMKVGSRWPLKHKELWVSWRCALWRCRNLSCQCTQKVPRDGGVSNFQTMQQRFCNSHLKSGKVILHAQHEN